MKTYRFGYARVSTTDQSFDIQHIALTQAGCDRIFYEAGSGRSAERLVLNFHVFAALAEFERHLISERTQAGLAAARARGRKGGRKPKIQDKERREIQALYAAKTIPLADIAKRYGVSRTTLYKHLSTENYSAADGG